MPKDWFTRALILAVAAYLVFCMSISYVVHAKALPGKNFAAWPDATVAPTDARHDTPAVTDQLRQQAADLSLQEQKLTLWQKALEDRAKDIYQRSSDLEKLVSEITIGSSVYTLLLGLFAAFGLKEAKDQAVRSLDEIKGMAEAQTTDLKKEFSDFQQKVEEQIPNLYGMQKSLGDLLNRIRREIDLTETWTSAKPYINLSEEQRQKILLSELTVASFDYFRLVSAGSQKSIAAQIFANLANFYSGRARVDEKRYDQGDLRRALIYIDRACEMDTENYRHLALRAALILTSGDREGAPVTREDLEKAAADLSRSLAIKPNFAAGLYNLAWVVDEQGDPGRATHLLTQFINERENLPPSDRGKRLIAAYINRACARAKLLTKDSADGQGKLLAEVLEDCRAACEEGKLYGETDYFVESLQRNSIVGTELYPLESLAPKKLKALWNGDCSDPINLTRAGE
jgi:tetratricopeptide (TPR) repeat protein